MEDLLPVVQKHKDNLLALTTNLLCGVGVKNQIDQQLYVDQETFDAVARIADQDERQITVNITQYAQINSKVAAIIPDLIKNVDHIERNLVKLITEPRRGTLEEALIHRLQSGDTLPDIINYCERVLREYALEVCDSRSKAASMLGVGRTTLVMALKRREPIVADA